MAKTQNTTPSYAELLDALLDIKRLANKSGDDEAEPYALLDLIAGHAQRVISRVR